MNSLTNSKNMFKFLKNVEKINCYSNLSYKEFIIYLHVTITILVFNKTCVEGACAKYYHVIMRI